MAYVFIEMSNSANRALRIGEYRRYYGKYKMFLQVKYLRHIVLTLRNHIEMIIQIKKSKDQDWQEIEREYKQVLTEHFVLMKLALKKSKEIGDAVMLYDSGTKFVSSSLGTDNAEEVDDK